MNTAEGKKTILVIDDEVDLVATLQDILEEEGYHIITAHNGEKGLQRLDHFSPDLIILDMNMPKMSGINVCQRLLEIGKTTGKNMPPVLILTARVQLSEIFRELKVAGFMSKPFQIDRLIAKVESILFPENENSSAPDGTVMTKILVAGHQEESLQEITAAFIGPKNIVLRAKDGVEALHLAQTRLPDIIFLSSRLEKLRGDVVALQLKRTQLTRHIPIILYGLSESAQSEEIETVSKEIGVNNLIQSSDPETLVKQLENYLPKAA